MKRLATAAALTLALLVGSFARADWRQAGGLDGGPMDIWIADAGGYFSVHTNGAAGYRMVDNGTTAVTVGLVPVPAAEAICSAIVGDKVKVATQTKLYDEANPGNPTLMPNQVTIFGCRVTDNLAATGYGDSPGGPSMTRCDAGTFGGVMNLVSGSDSQTAFFNAISAHTIFGRDYSYVARPAGPPPLGGMFVVDGAPLSPFFQGSNPGIQRSEIFGTRAGTVRVIQVGTDGGQLLTLDAPNPVVFEGFGLPFALAPAAHRIKAAALSELEGGPNGAGFGMMVVVGAGVPNVWRAIPDPNNVGRHWVPTTLTPPGPTVGDYDSVRCLDGKFCVLGSSASTNPAQNQLLLYRNLAAPAVGAPAFVVQEGLSGGQSMTVDAGDADGDAIFVTWVIDPSSSGFFNSLGPDPAVHDGRTYLGFAKPNPALCGLVQASIPVTVSANDGLNQGSPATGAITVVHNPPGQPGPDQTTGIQAGLPFATQTYSFISNGCPSLGTEIVPSTPATATLTTSTTLDVRFTPPRVWCDDTPDSGVRQFQVKVVDGAVKSPAATATFVILPWGEPEQPFGAGRAASQDAGTTVTYRPDATHLCQGDAGTFPGVDTRWTWSFSGAGFTPLVLQADTSLLPQSGAVTPTATVVAPVCQSGTITFQVTNTTRMTGGLSASSPLTVDVSSALLPLSGTLTVTAVPDAGSVSGVVDLNPIQCPQNRPGLGASVELHRASDGGLISSGTVAGVPAAYSLPAPGACGGGAFYVRGSVSDATGTVGPVDLPVDLPALNPGFASVDVEPFKIACGDVARAHASVTFGPADCDSAQVDWTSAGAVAIAPSDAGPSVDLTTVSNDFNGLIGLPVDVVATATAETGTRSVNASPVPIVTVDPFVTVVHRTDTAVASESRVLGVEVQLTNGTACDVSGVELHEALDGVRLVDGSITGPDGGKIDGVPDGGGEFVVPGLSLPAGQVVTVRYLVQPTLFGDPSPGGVVTLRDVPISTRSGLTGGGSTCGCQSASGGATALIGLWGAALLRRRRKVRARS